MTQRLDKCDHYDEVDGEAILASSAAVFDHLEKRKHKSTTAATSVRASKH